MKFKITYVDRNITQTFFVVRQDLYNRFRNLEQKNKDDIELTDEETVDFELCSLYLKTEEEKNKDAILCTSESPIGQAFLRNDDKLILPLYQGGIIDVKTKML